MIIGLKRDIPWSALQRSTSVILRQPAKVFIQLVHPLIELEFSVKNVPAMESLSGAVQKERGQT